MPKIIVKDIPEDLYQYIKNRAQREKRSLSSEVIQCLESVLKMKRRNASEIIKRARRLRKGIDNRLTNESLNALKSKGRL